jgi:hypothetical protein
MDDQTWRLKPPGIHGTIGMTMANITPPKRSVS